MYIYAYIYLPQSDLTSLPSSHGDEKPEDEAGPFTHTQISSPGAILRAVLGFLVQEAQKAGLAPSTQMLPAIPAPREFGMAPQEFPLLWSPSAFSAHPCLSPKPCSPLWDREKSHFPPRMGGDWLGLAPLPGCCAKADAVPTLPAASVTSPIGKKLKITWKKVKFQISNKKLPQ